MTKEKLYGISYLLKEKIHGRTPSLEEVSAYVETHHGKRLTSPEIRECFHIVQEKLSSSGDPGTYHFLGEVIGEVLETKSLLESLLLQIQKLENQVSDLTQSSGTSTSTEALISGTHLVSLSKIFPKGTIITIQIPR